MNNVTGTDANKLIIEKVKTYLFLYFRNPCASINLTNLILGFLGEPSGKAERTPNLSDSFASKEFVILESAVCALLQLPWHKKSHKESQDDFIYFMQNKGRSSNGKLNKDPNNLKLLMS